MRHKSKTLFNTDLIWKLQRLLLDVNLTAVFHGQLMFMVYNNFYLILNTIDFWVSCLFFCYRAPITLIRFQEMQYLHSVPGAVLYNEEIDGLQLVCIFMRREKVWHQWTSLIPPLFKVPVMYVCVSGLDFYFLDLPIVLFNYPDSVAFLC